MYTPTTPQAPRIHKMRLRLCAIGHKVNPFLNASPFHSRETWFLLQARTVCILRYTRGDHGEPKDQGQACTEVKEGEGRRASCYSGQTSGPSWTSGPSPGNPASAIQRAPQRSSAARTSGHHPGHPARPEAPDIRLRLSAHSEGLKPMYLFAP